MMREIIGLLHNEFFVQGDTGALIPKARVVLLYLEEHYGQRQGGEIGELPLRRDFAFNATADGLRRLSADLAKVADSLDESASAFPLWEQPHDPRLASPRRR